MRDQHMWRVYDENHRACDRCGLRLFRRKHLDGQVSREWVLLTWNGVPVANLLQGPGRNSNFGSCVQPRRIGSGGDMVNSGSLVLIEYTGDPDIHFGCERVMHLLPDAAEPGLLDVSNLRPKCGWQCEFWELGPARYHAGWNWCATCFPEVEGARTLDGVSVEDK